MCYLVTQNTPGTHDYLWTWWLGFYREHHWPLDEEEGAVVFDESGSVHGLLKHGAHIVSDPHLGKVVSLEAESEAWIELGDFSGELFDSYISSFD